MTSYKDSRTYKKLVRLFGKPMYADRRKPRNASSYRSLKWRISKSAIKKVPKELPFRTFKVPEYLSMPKEIVTLRIYLRNTNGNESRR
jgi:hypothetical protein